MILLTGAKGKLGTELQKHQHFFAPERRLMDITKPGQWPTDVDMIVHCAAYTDVTNAEKNHRACFDTNVTGTLNLVDYYSKIPFVYISSEYAHKPANFYSLTKSLAEQIVTTHPNYLIIRTLFKERPWKYPFAFKDKWTLGDYIDVIAEKIIKEINGWDGKSKMVYVGTGRKTYFDLALETNPDVIGNSIKDIKGVKIPQDYR